MKRLTVVLHDDEQDALLTLSMRERRQLREQAAILIRHGLYIHGLLPESDSPINKPLAEDQNGVN